MNKKIKQKRTLILVLAIILAFAIVSLVSDKEEQVSVVVLNEELDPEKTIPEQLSKFKTVSINKADFESMGSSFVTSIGQLNVENLKITVPVAVKNPIPVSLVAYSKAGSELTNSLPTYRTWYKLDNSGFLLPPGVTEGDLVDIGVLYNDIEKQDAATFGMLLYGVKIAKIQDALVYFEVTQEQHSKLTVSSKVGSFVLQLPGKKDTSNCGKLTPEQRESVDCFNDYDRPISINSHAILDLLKNSSTGGSNLEKIFEKNPKFLISEGVLFEILKGNKNSSVEENPTIDIVEENENEDVDVTDMEVEGSKNEDEAASSAILDIIGR